MFHADGMNSKSGYQLRSPILTFRCSNFAGARQDYQEGRGRKEKLSLFCYQLNPGTGHSLRRISSVHSEGYTSHQQTTCPNVLLAQQKSPKCVFPTQPPCRGLIGVRYRWSRCVPKRPKKIGGLLFPDNFSTFRVRLSRALVENPRFFLFQVIERGRASQALA